MVIGLFCVKFQILMNLLKKAHLRGSKKAISRLWRVSKMCRSGDLGIAPGEVAFKVSKLLYFGIGARRSLAICFGALELLLLGEGVRAFKAPPSSAVQLEPSCLEAFS